MARKVNQNRKEKAIKTPLSCNCDYFKLVKTVGRRSPVEFLTDDSLTSTLARTVVDSNFKNFTYTNWAASIGASVRF